MTNSNIPQNNCNETIAHTKRAIVQADLCQEIVSVCGVLLPKVNCIPKVREISTVANRLQNLKQMVTEDFVTFSTSKYDVHCTEKFKPCTQSAIQVFFAAELVISGTQCS